MMWRDVVGCGVMWRDVACCVATDVVRRDVASYGVVLWRDFGVFCSVVVCYGVVCGVFCKVVAFYGVFLACCVRSRRVMAWKQRQTAPP